MQCDNTVNCSPSLHLPHTTYSMPTHTDRQLAADALHQQFLVNFIAELESWELDFSSDSEGNNSMEGSDGSSSDSNTTSSLSSSDGDDSDLMTPAQLYIHHMGNLYSQHYMAEQREIPKTKGLMQLLLGYYRHTFPDIFQSHLHIDPDCFDLLVEAIHDNEVFHNNSHNFQISVEEQIVIAFYCFDHHGNAASIMKVAPSISK